ncbi:MAG: hypothetical protein C0404_01600 [Verrucomicrobia bacterium]|nr:hypothetical protein [Verrucomicrobiota bacterium]
MKPGSKLAVGGLLLAAALASLGWMGSRYVIRTSEGYAVVPKRFFSLSTVYVDARTWTYRDFDARPEIRKAMTSHGYGDYITDLRAAETRAAVDDARAYAETGWLLLKDAVRVFVDRYADDVTLYVRKELIDRNT